MSSLASSGSILSALCLLWSLGCKTTSISINNDGEGASRGTSVEPAPPEVGDGPTQSTEPLAASPDASASPPAHGDPIDGPPGEPPTGPHEPGGPCVDAACPAVPCPPDDVCRNFPDELAAGSCSTPGICLEPEACSFDWTEAARVGEACVCDPERCQLRVAEPCTRDAECGSQLCRPTAANHNLCCAEACADGEVCSDDGSDCEPEPECSDDEERCSGDHQRCVESTWTTLQQCGDRGCALERGGCLKAVGESCETSEQCAAGTCQPASDGSRICCSAECDVACKACASSGTRCNALLDDDRCNIACPADTPCRAYYVEASRERCSNGMCANPSELCSFTAQNSGESCGESSRCNAVGSCESCNAQGECGGYAVACGSVPTCTIDTSSSRCCMNTTLTNGAPMCTDSDDCHERNFRISASCSDTAHCDSGQVCCLRIATAPPYEIFIECAAASECNREAQGSVAHEICFSPGMANERPCPSGTRCEAYSTIDTRDWKACFPQE